jgi:hypothetical protein
VHGLNPQSSPNFARATWTANDNFWPTEQLRQIAPASRVFLYSYNSQVAHDVSKNGIEDHANNLLVRLSGKRAVTENAVGNATASGKLLLTILLREISGQSFSLPTVWGALSSSRRS